MSTVDLAIMAWFAVSVTTFVCTNVVFHFWLNAKVPLGVVGSLFAGTPGYLDAVYIGWCKDQGRPYRNLIALRVVLLINTVLAATMFIFVAKTHP